MEKKPTWMLNAYRYLLTHAALAGNMTVFLETWRMFQPRGDSPPVHDLAEIGWNRMRLQREIMICVTAAMMRIVVNHDGAEFLMLRDFLRETKPPSQEELALSLRELAIVCAADCLNQLRSQQGGREVYQTLLRLLVVEGVSLGSIGIGREGELAEYEARFALVRS